MESRKNFFLDTFPPPDYLNMPVLCVDVSEKSLKFIELERKKGESFDSSFWRLFFGRGDHRKRGDKTKDKLIGILKTIKKRQKQHWLARLFLKKKPFERGEFSANE